MVLAGAQSARGSPAPGHEMQSQPMHRAHNHDPVPKPALTVVMPSGGCNAPSIWVPTVMLIMEGLLGSHLQRLEMRVLLLKCGNLWGIQTLMPPCATSHHS